MTSIFASLYSGPLAAFLASATWALGVVAYSSLATKYPPYIVNLTRVLIGLPLFIIILLFTDGALATWHSLVSVEGYRYLWLLVAVLCSYAFGDVLFFESAKRLGATSALALASVYPLWAALSGWLFKGEAFRFLQGVGVVLVVGGSIFVILASATRNSSLEIKSISPRNKWIGVILGIATSISWATNSYAINRGGESLSVVLVNVIRLLMALFLAPLIGILRQGPSSFRWIEWKHIRPFAFFVLAECFFGPLLYMYGLTRSSLAVGSVLSSLAPVMSVPVAIALRTERFSKRKVGGVLLVVSGICLLLIY